MVFVLVGYPEKCTGCGLCEDACSFEHEEAFSPSLSRITVARNESRQVFTPTLRAITFVNGKAAGCDLCRGDPECVKICPTDALRFIDKCDVGKDKGENIIYKTVEAI